jgi:ketosteroid isomerase-like protein
MTPAKAETVRRYYRDLAQLDRVWRDPAASEEQRAHATEAAVARWHEDCEWQPAAAALVEGASFHGHDGLRSFFSMMGDVMESVEIDLDDVQEIGGFAVALGHLRARGRGSGATIEEEHGVVFEVRDGLIARAVSYRSMAEAREAATLRGSGRL